MNHASKQILTLTAPLLAVSLGCNTIRTGQELLDGIAVSLKGGETVQWMVKPMVKPMVKEWRKMLPKLPK